MASRLAIDPGDKHVGWARELSSGVETGEWDPEEACWTIIHLMTQDEISELIVEEYVLYDRKYEDQAWSSFKTVQLIGALKLIARMFRIPVTEQGAYIKKPTRAQLRGRGIKQVGVGTHARDAELHLYHRMIREGSLEKCRKSPSA